MKRFWDKVKKTDDYTEGCWKWIGGKDKDGYGKFKFMGRTIRAHRFVFELENRPIPKGLLVLHTCDNPKCVRPSHLFLGSHLANVRDMISKGRKVVAKGKALSHPGEKNPSAKLSLGQVETIRAAYDCGDWSIMELAKEFDMGRETIRLIVRRELWNT